MREGGKEGGILSVKLANAHEAWTLTGKEEELRQWRIAEWESMMKLVS